jgi:hypothetical protein
VLAQLLEGACTVVGRKQNKYYCYCCKPCYCPDEAMMNDEVGTFAGLLVTVNGGARNVITILKKIHLDRMKL